MEKILQIKFGYPNFRGQQGAIVDRTLQQQHSLVIMPTGMGKSLCYQIPALVMAGEEPTERAGRGISLVLSPLVALMKDQVDALCAKGVSATFINSSPVSYTHLTLPTTPYV